MLCVPEPYQGAMFRGQWNIPPGGRRPHSGHTTVSLPPHSRLHLRWSANSTEEAGKNSTHCQEWWIPSNGHTGQSTDLRHSEWTEAHEVADNWGFLLNPFLLHLLPRREQCEKTDNKFVLL